ncbi:hypothetical protein [Dongia sp. agr-C8]
MTQSDGGPGVPARPGWAIALEILGWLIIALSAVGAFQYVQPLYIALTSATVLAMAGAPFIFGSAIGLAMIIVGRHRRPRARRSLFSLWAKLVMLFGATLWIGWPTMAYGLLMFIASNDGSGGVWETDDLVIFPLLYRAILMSALPLAIGSVAILIALIWGRRKPEPDIPAVFS